MAAQTIPYFVTPQEYLAQEWQAATKHEYMDGVIVAMAGADPEHNKIVFSLTAALGAQLPSHCQGNSSDQRVRVNECNVYFYPDLTVVCGEPRYEVMTGLRSLLNPTAIFEVLSPSTLCQDYEDKWDCYRTLESLRVFVLISQSRCQVETYTRGAQGEWQHDVYTEPDAVLKIGEIGGSLRLADIYARVRFEDAATQTDSAPEAGRALE